MNATNQHAEALEDGPLHIALNGWFWDQPHTGSGQYLRHLLDALHRLAPEHRLTLVIPSHMRVLDALPALVDVLPVQGRFGGHLGKVLFEQQAFPNALKRLRPDLAHVPYWAPPLRSPVPVVCTVLDVIPLDASLVKGSHGAAPPTPDLGPLLISSQGELVPADTISPTDVCGLILRHLFG